MSVMDGVTELEGEHSVGAHLTELSPELKRREAVLVQAVVPTKYINYYYYYIA